MNLRLEKKETCKVDPQVLRFILIMGCVLLFFILFVFLQVMEASPRHTFNL